MSDQDVLNGVGIALAGRLGLRFDKREGHDLAGACIACQSSDAFRLHADKAVAYCYSCGGKWSPSQLAEAVLGSPDGALRLLGELGLYTAPPRNGQSARKSEIDTIGMVASKKGVTREALIAFGAEAATPTTVKLPAYGPDGKACTEFTIPFGDGKGKFAKGKPAGLFLPHENGVVRLPRAGETWHLVEGPKDAAALHGLGLLACGLNTCRLAKKFARLFREVNVILIPDRDRAGEDGADHSGGVLHGLAASERIAVLPAEFKESGGDDVRDVLRQSDGTNLVLQAIADARVWEPKAAERPDSDGLPEIEVTPDEHRVNDEAVEALGRDKSLYQRGGALVQIQRDHSLKSLKGIVRPPNAPRIIPLREPTLRERLTKVARFVTKQETEDGMKTTHVHPPSSCVKAVAARGHWPMQRHLEGVISSPILRSDGSVLQTPGYDAETGLYYEPDGPAISVPIEATLADARSAVDELLEVVADFPFATPSHRSAWLALAITPLARFAFQGPSPLFLIDANIRGSGKSLLADAAAIIVTGRNMARMSQPRDDDEMRKRITALALGGDQLVLIDNIAGELGSAALDAALTSTVWKDRILGRSEIVEMPLLATWAATGNNVVLMADTSRRVCHIRLDSKLENPEEREGFRHPNLLAWLISERRRLLASALTILSAYCRAGRPRQELKPWGSFEGWSDLVRQALVWAGQPDPGATRQELARASDREAQALRALILGWPEIDPDGTGLAATKIIDRLAQEENKYDTVRAAVLELCPAPFGKLPSTRSLGNKLRSLRGRNVGGKALDKRDSHGTAVWFVTQVGDIPASSGWSGGSGWSVRRSSEFANCDGADSTRSDSEQPDPPEHAFAAGGEPSSRYEEGEL